MSELVPVGYDDLRDALRKAQAEDNGGIGNHMWAVAVDRMGAAVAVCYSGEEQGDQWPGSRLIAAQKANTANALSLDNKSLPTAQLYSGAQPGGFMYGIISTPLNADAAYGGNPMAYGSKKDHLVGRAPGGVVVFGGGLALYSSEGTIAGGLGVSGDYSCTDHIIAWKIRHYLELDYVPNEDNIIYDIDPQTGKSESGWGHPECPGRTKEISLALPQSHPIRTKRAVVVKGETTEHARSAQ